ncbi:MAG: type II toxin-antitoxin system VapC family toxin [Pseudomonadota bacterium]|nr:type II toxin-antitoxin system VapC family toxin [Pseudomonadota bacterium]
MIVVLDASVVLKWLLADPVREPDTDKAVAVMQSVVQGKIRILQPLHWLVEAAAVMARLSPRNALQDVGMLSAMQLPVCDEPAVLQRAIALGIETGQHLFDTLYHAVALENEGALLVTADARYCEKAGHHGGILPLRDAGRLI